MSCLLIIILCKRLACFGGWGVERNARCTWHRFSTTPRMGWIFQHDKDIPKLHNIISVRVKSLFLANYIVCFAPSTYWRSLQWLMRTLFGSSSILIAKTELGTITEFRIRFSGPEGFCPFMLSLSSEMSCLLIIILCKRLACFGGWGVERNVWCTWHAFSTTPRMGWIFQLDKDRPKLYNIISKRVKSLFLSNYVVCFAPATYWRRLQ